MVNNVEPELKVVEEALKGILKQNKKKKLLSADQINEMICDFYSIDKKDVIGPRRNKEYVRPRQILMYLLKNELRLSYPNIGRYLGGRDHTTVMHGCGKIEKELKKNEDLFSEIKNLKSKLYQVT